MLHRSKAVACSSRNVDSSMEYLNWRRGITPLRTLELYLKHADSREFERTGGHGVVTSICDVIAEAINLRRPDCCCLSGAINIGS